MSQYPAVSHTFFLNEIQALRERGFEIETASINAVSPPQDGFSPRELLECDSTYYLKAMSKAAALRRLLGLAVAHPGVVMRGLAEVFSLASWDLHSVMYGGFYLAEALLLGAWMRENKCGHLHVHFSGPVATVGLLTSVAWDIPYSITIHGPDEFYNIDAFYLSRKIDRASFVVCISDFCKSQLLRIAAPPAWPKFRVCRLGVDETVFQPAAKASSSVARLISVGRLHPSKGHPILLQAIAKLRQRGYLLRLDLIGGGAERASLEGMIAEHGLQSVVTLHGAMSHEGTRALLQGADIFVLASFAEGVPVALMEAMAMEIPCISTYIAGIPELIHSQEDGWLVAPSSVEELSEAIAGLLDDPARREALGASGRKTVLERYNLARNSDHLAAVFREELAAIATKTVRSGSGDPG